MGQRLAARKRDLSTPVEPLPAPKLLFELEPGGAVFLRNLRDLFREEKHPRLRLTSWPGQFWPDVFVERPLPWRRFAESYAGHIALIVVVLGLFQIWPSRPQVIQPAAFSSKDVIYYDAAEYLPPIDTGRPRTPVTHKGDPALAPQPILSVPPEADNPKQTIVTPPNIQLKQDVPLPNMVAWSPTSPTVPLSATARPTADLKLPTLTTQVVAPAPRVDSSLKRSLSLDGSVVAPAPDVNAATIRKLGDLSIGHSEVIAPAPKLAMSEQRLRSPGQAALGNSAAVPPPPAITGMPSKGGGQLIALGVRPMAPATHVVPPAGNRRGTFAATPDGKSIAAGTPDSAHGQSATSVASGKSANGIPSGLQVGGASKTSAIGGSGRTSPQLLADARQPRVGESARPAELFDNPNSIDREVFGDRKSYSLTLNMPNLNSGGGSWVIHFAELDAGVKGELAAPVAEQKVDPGYPTELMRHNVGGNVTLYAVIRSDGSVANVRVLQSVDDRLNDYAAAALTRWHFRPATKNGSPVALEAVVTIPFRPVRNKSSF
ncbi:MAG: TonB family protein [Terriglobales bacterium]